MTRAVVWDDRADARLLAAIIETVPSINYKQVADILGNGLTANAVHHRIRKIKTKAIGTESGPATPTATPKKNASATPRKAGGVKRQASIKGEDEDLEDEELEQAVKREKNAKKTKVEDHDNADDMADEVHVK